MKNKKIFKILFSLLMILLFVLISKSSNSVQAMDATPFNGNEAEFKASFDEAYNMDGPWTALCRQHGKALGGKIDKTDMFSMVYTRETGPLHIEPATGYAIYCGASYSEIQNVSWYSRIWTGGTNNVVEGTSKMYNVVVPARYNEYGEVYYNIIKPAKDNNIYNNLFNLTDTSESNVRLFVNQQNGKYIVGPYKISLNTIISSPTAKSYLYNELINWRNQGHPYAKFDINGGGISGINGSGYRLLDANGWEIQFPDFINSKDFYIEFTPNNSGNIQTAGTPSINVQLLDDFNYNVDGIWKVNAVKINYTAANGYSKKVSILAGDHDLRKNRFNGVGTVWNSQLICYLQGYTSRFQKINGKIYLAGWSSNDHWSDFKSDLQINKYCNIQIGGTVWLEGGDIKTNSIDGKYGNGDVPFGGIQVQLYDKTSNSLVAVTTTDKNGHYRFYGTNNNNGEMLLNPLHKYYVTFVYNGQLYQATYYHKQLTSPGYSNAKDVLREEFNAKFTRIDSDSANYKLSGTDKWNRAYAAKHKLKTDDGSYISYSGHALLYEDVWNQFLTYATNTSNYDLSPKKSDASAYWGAKGNTIVWNGQSYGNSNATLKGANYNYALEMLKNWMNSLRVGQSEQNNIIQFIKDSMMVATTLQDNKTYPFDTNGNVNYIINNVETPEDGAIYFGNVYYPYLYRNNCDQSRWVDFGVTQREVADLALGKDLFRVTMLVNGKKETYDYNRKNLNDDGVWEIKARASDALFNGADFYNRPVRSSEYLFNQSDSYGGANIKNLQVWVTYKIAIKNQGTVDVDLNNTEIVDYYDASQYTFDGDLNGNTYTPKRYNQNNFDINSYIGKDGNGTILSDNALKVSTEASGQARNPSHEEIKGGNYDYNTLYLTGLRSTSGSDTLGVGQYSYVYITFKVNGDSNTGRIMLDQNLDNGALTIGKRNIAEINAYSTKYTSDQSIPNNLDGYTKISVGGRTSGLIDTDSNPGSLSSRDLDNDGNIINDANNEVNNRLEDDTDKAPNLKITIDTNKDNVRKFKGMVYEDNRTENANKSKIGNGTYDNGETKINGVTMQLVELVQNVDNNGFATGTYSGEKVWASYNYNNLKDEPTRNYDRYYSGTNSSKVILSGPGILKVDANGLSEGQGQYEFDSIPAGDFYIRFVYGDTTQTTLTNTNNDVNNLVGNSVDGLKGLNAKSYNGQDYKSTVYQSGINQNTSYNGIKGFTNADLQNYAKIDDVDKVENGNVQMAVHDKDSDFATQRYGIPEKDKMYYYDIGESDKNSSISDAKDVYDYREIANRYSSNNNIDDGGRAETKDAANGVLNNKAEILDSFERLATDSNGDAKNTQIGMIRNFMNNTRMVAQTGIINTEIERNTQNLNNITKNGNGYSNTHDYSIDNIDLGLAERPRAQLKLNKQVSNLKIVLANQQVLFNSNKSVKNLAYVKHSGHKITYKDLRLNGVAVSANNTKESPELINAYMDDELLEGSNMQVEYTLTVTNVGEVDYKDKQYYYTGRTNDASENNVSKTNAVNVIDYHGNDLYFNNEENGQWNVKNANEITNNGDSSKNIVNRKYADEIKTYDTLLLTGTLSNGEGLTPELFFDNNNKGYASKSTKLVLSSELSADPNGGNLVFNNLSEIVATTNSQGRRMQFSIVGNQEMADQSLGNNAAENVYSSEDLVTPSEIDADSAQKIVVMPPTGENKNYIPIIVGSIVGAIVIIGAVILIRKYAKKQ